MIKLRNTLITILVVSLIFYIGYSMGQSTSLGHDHSAVVTQTDSSDKSTAPEIWTCSMHPQIQQPQAGKCPLCGMDLILQETTENTNAETIILSPYAQKLAEVVTSKVIRRTANMELRLTGKVMEDETRIFHITTRAAGRIEKMFVDYTGMEVQKGDHLFTLYSPKLVLAQKELLTSNSYAKLREKELYRDPAYSSAETRNSARKKLELYDFTKKQIDRLQQTKKLQYDLIVYSPTDGIVINKNALPGTYVKEGSRVYTIANLKEVWVHLDAYEQHLPWIRFGAKVDFEVEGIPGKTFAGQVVFIDPIVNIQTRTIRIRLNVKNQELLLKPGMFVRAVVKVPVTAEGTAVTIDFSGKWLCPMHREILKDEADNCPICEMPLVTAESLGFTQKEKDTLPLLIPVSAPLLTGKRAVVYVEIAGSPGEYEGRVVRLGTKVGDYYVVLSGLKEGEKVVSRGNFKLDASLQLLARTSMMNPSETESNTTENITPANSDNMTINKKRPPSFKKSLMGFIMAFLKISDSLSKDDLTAAKEATLECKGALDIIEIEDLDQEDLQNWHKLQPPIAEKLQSLFRLTELENFRKDFSDFSTRLTDFLHFYNSSLPHSVYRFHCPMAFDGKGADWIQSGKKTKNPYYGTKMLGCGDLEEIIGAKGE